MPLTLQDLSIYKQTTMSHRVPKPYLITSELCKPSRPGLCFQLPQPILPSPQLKPLDPCHPPLPGSIQQEFLEQRFKQLEPSCSCCFTNSDLAVFNNWASLSCIPQVWVTLLFSSDNSLSPSLDNL